MNITSKKLLIMSITILMMILLSQIFGYVGNTFDTKFATVTERVNFRKTANTESSSIVKTLPKNTAIKLVGDIDNFYITFLENNEVGLISKDFIQITENSTQTFEAYQKLDKFMVEVLSANTNLRGGPGTTYTNYLKLPAGLNVQVIGSINDWYLVITPTNTVGMIRQDLVKKVENNGTEETPSTLPNTSETVLKLMNEARAAQGINPLKIDDLLNSTAQAKAVDMVKNNYFSHESPTYGSPFKMMQNAGITYRTAGENIAGNPSVENAVKSWLASESHRQNILSNAYNYVGIGIEESPSYGYVIVAMFIGK
ncbi:MAG: CAP domain-containing protein [Clostridia bacterium]|nr:CAP domain-containing protein [Clostridia bacterium]